MDDIIYTLVQSIERDAFPCSYTDPEYLQNQHHAQKHLQWLEEHLNEEEKEHLEKARDAELLVDTAEREALIRTAIAVGIRMTLSC